jgi:radical SAM protein with 4Fe4S-binding SPASM domain
VKDSFVERIRFPSSSLWDKVKNENRLIYFSLELTARCNNNCSHCYVNFPVNDKKATERELSYDEIKKIVDQAVGLGALSCLITGGEPLLREDFFDIYLYLKKKGILISVFTNATLITEKHARFFKKYPPTSIEITVYGVTKETYERVTRKAGSFDAFMRGLNLLLKNNIKVSLKTMALRSNRQEMPQIASFCSEMAGGGFHFDPFLHLRTDGNEKRNSEIKAERLSPEEITAIQKMFPKYNQALKKECDRFIVSGTAHDRSVPILFCGAGIISFAVSYDGFFRLCSSLCHPACIYDLKKGSLTEARYDFSLRVRDMRSDRENFLKKCRVCPIINLCMWCPANSHLETGNLDQPVDYFCEVAHERAALLDKNYSRRSICVNTPSTSKARTKTPRQIKLTD